MAFVGFDDTGYEYFDNYNLHLFSSNNSHYYLFDYVTKDLSCLHELFEQYVSTRMDTTTFNLKNCQESNDDINNILKILKPIHPYFEHDFKKDIRNKIGNYFNKLLVYTVYNLDRDLKEYAIQEDWYKIGRAHV